ncbi:MoaD/ThiS family protein [Thermococcus sp. GR7]|uniref:MoaD/ThiS family protein n=1 Tax=unclassified Thermococcus TaxID=2627626 RepID=UPI00142F8C29|nr:MULTISPECIES: MoaD/ThiS family protein [unclassified Thermococcus]NJE47232.1 MoaD/ThiS family protein [Thermococcus sp. GR7]NJE79025.1 MoaD/ThiS family protein [Thermococcus sp. GR4]NJF22635.1 MoaD/ThiS family protein [Thermococcus sp. GR5]
MIRIRLMGVFAYLAKARELNVRIEDKKTVDEILREVIPRYDEFKEKIIFINGQPARGDAEVIDGDEIKVMPVLSGG